MQGGSSVNIKLLEIKMEMKPVKKHLKKHLCVCVCLCLCVCVLIGDCCANEHGVDRRGIRIK